MTQTFSYTGYNTHRIRIRFTCLMPFIVTKSSVLGYPVNIHRFDMAGHWLCLLLLLWGFSEATTDPETQKKTEQPSSTMAPNSKFLNPHVDDATNLQFAIAAFADESSSPEDNESKASEILSKLSESWGLNVSSRSSKSLDDWKLIPFLQSLINGNKNYKFKRV